MGIYIPYEIGSIDNSSLWKHVFQHKTDPSVGYELDMITVSNIQAISKIYEGKTHKAKYFSGPTTSSTAIYESTANNVKYFSLESTDDSITYNINSTEIFNTLIAHYVGVSGGGKASIEKNSTVVGTIDTNDPPTNYWRYSTHSSFTVTKGDVLRIVRSTEVNATARISNIVLYDASTNLKKGYDGEFVLSEKLQISQTQSSFEFAFKLKMESTGSERWIGGSAHQGSTGAMIEKNTVDSWKKDGQVWEKTRGFVSGDFTYVKHTDVDWDGSTNIVANVDMVYYFGRRSYGVKYAFTCTTDLILSICYPMMLPAMESSLISLDSVTLDGSFDVLSDITSPSTYRPSTDNLKNITGCYFENTPLGFQWHQKFIAKSNVFTDVFVISSTSMRKMFFRSEPSFLEGSVISAKWFGEFVNNYDFQNSSTSYKRLGGNISGQNMNAELLNVITDSLKGI